jgi:class 3 adenylate cyclase
MPIWRKPTSLVDSTIPEFAAEVYKAYLHCAAKVIRSEDGEITAYDGDRIMAVFLGQGKDTRAVRAGLKVNWARTKIINPAIRAQYSNERYEVRHTVGIDTGELFVARTGSGDQTTLYGSGVRRTMLPSYPAWIHPIQPGSLKQFTADLTWRSCIPKGRVCGKYAGGPR